jgi:hypothetical protein
MGFGQLTRTQRVLLLRHIRNTDRDLYDYIRTIRKMKKILPVICGNGDVQAINTTQVPETTVTVGNIVGASSDTYCGTCYSDCIVDCTTNFSDAIKKGYSTVDECEDACYYS